MSTYGYDATGKNSDAFGSLYASTQSQRSQVAQYAIMRAATYLKESKNDEALRELKKALAFDPQNTDIHTNIGKIYLSQGKTREAITTFKTVAQLQPLMVSSHINLANAYLQSKQYAASEKEFKTAARLDPTDPLANYTLGHQYLQTDRLAEAEALFLKVKKISPNDANVYYSLGTLYNKQEKYQEATTNLEKALKLKKSFPAASYELGLAYSKLGRSEDALNQLSILSSSDTSLASDLKFAIEKPGINYMDASNSGGFVSVLGAGTPLWMLDPSLMEADSSKEFNMTIGFTNEMDVASVMDTMNWSISRSSGTGGGYYNNTAPIIPDKEVSISPIPLRVAYNPTTLEATITFRISQNSNANATIDPSHLVFKFSGKDAAGRSMDTSSDEIDGFSVTPF